MEIPIKELINYTLPAFIIALIAIMIIAYRSLKLTRTIKKYEDDLYRQSIEKKIMDLEQQLVISQQRFETVNHLVLDGQRNIKVISKSNDESITDNKFFQSLGVDVNVKIDEDLVFVIMPFNNEFRYTYDMMKFTIEELGLKCMRGDEQKLSSNILAHIIQQMINARLIIADITGRNPNVFYELGMAHALNKPILIVSRSSSDVPFDVNYIRVLFYNTPNDLSSTLRKWLVNSLRLAK